SLRGHSPNENKFSFVLLLKQPNWQAICLLPQKNYKRKVPFRLAHCLHDKKHLTPINWDEMLRVATHVRLRNNNKYKKNIPSIKGRNV
ncbi:hypothetical protein, partial [Alkalibaculum sporogenes]|uniref:hypothetical protein n=1 Tax=Alkalibaculum sporogenes TaxID=2655001 RepID=UPI003CCD7B3D